MKIITIFFVVYMTTLVAAQRIGRLEGRIFNGFTAVKGQFPYQALLLQDTIKNTTEFCGGALISNKHILTAAHCSHGTYRTQVYLGVVDTHDGNGVLHCIVDNANTFVHPYYNPDNYQNDIAILKLPINVPITDKILPISLPKRVWAPPSTFDNYIVEASGWGETFNGEQGMHRFLQYRKVGKMPQKQCVNYYNGLNPVTDNMICTDKKIIFSGPCHGDSGGPLTVRLTSGLYLIGAVSWSVGNCSAENPVVYVNVAYFLPWISSITGLPTY